LNERGVNGRWRSDRYREFNVEVKKKCDRDARKEDWELRMVWEEEWGMRRYGMSFWVYGIWIGCVGETWWKGIGVWGYEPLGSELRIF
jgi:hypothetical protein